MSMPEPKGDQRGGAGGTEPTAAELTAALAAHVDRTGSVPPGVATGLREERAWKGRLVDILETFSQSAERLGYMAGGRRPDEIVTWLEVWSDADLTTDEIALIADAGGWDPDPFVALVRAGLLEPFLRTPDGSIRIVHGERAGAWVSDELASATDAQVVAAVRGVIEADTAPA